MSRALHLDYEFRSGVDINDVGSHRCSIDSEFEIFFCAASWDDEDRVYLWVNPKFKTPDLMGDENTQVEAMIEEVIRTDEYLFYAHNAPNEYANTWGALEQGKACPFKMLPPVDKFRCVAAIARRAGLPNSLEDLCEVLEVTDPKDKKGKDLIRLFSGKQDPTKKQLKLNPSLLPEFTRPQDRPEEFFAFGEYCKQDVRAEKANHKKLKPFELSGLLLQMFLFDLRLNQRGIPVNVEGARKAQRLIWVCQAGVRDEFRRITGLNPTQRAKVKVWLEEHGCEMENMQAVTVEQVIEDYDTKIGGSMRDCLPAQVLRLYQKVQYSAVAKIHTMLECVCPDGRVRGGHFFYGAGTGRWSGKLLQPQNFKKTPPEQKHLTDEVYAAICRGWPAWAIREIWGEPLEMISICIRHFIHDTREAA